MKKNKWIVAIDGADAFVLKNEGSFFSEEIDVGETIDFNISSIVSPKASEKLVKSIEDKKSGDLVNEHISFKQLDHNEEVLRLVDVVSPRISRGIVVKKHGVVSSLNLSLEFDTIYTMHRDYEEISALYSVDYYKLRNVVDRLKSVYDDDAS